MCGLLSGRGRAYWLLSTRSSPTTTVTAIVVLNQRRYAEFSALPPVPGVGVDPSLDEVVATDFSANNDDAEFSAFKPVPV